MRRRLNGYRLEMTVTLRDWVTYHFDHRRNLLGTLLPRQQGARRALRQPTWEKTMRERDSLLAYIRNIFKLRWSLKSQI